MHGPTSAAAPPTTHPTSPVPAILGMPSSPLVASGSLNQSAFQKLSMRFCVCDSIYIYTHVHLHIYIYKYIHIYRCACIRINIYTYIHMCACMCLSLMIHKSTRARIYMETYARVCIGKCKHMYTYMYMHIYIHNYILIYVSTCTHKNLTADTHVYIYTCIHTDAQININNHISVRCTYVVWSCMRI